MCMNHAGFACSMPCSLVTACWNAYMHANSGLNDEIMKTFLLIFCVIFILFVQTSHQLTPDRVLMLAF